MRAAGETEEEDMAHPIQRARQALRNAEAQTEQADGNQTEDDIEAGPGEGPPGLESLALCHTCISSYATPAQASHIRRNSSGQRVRAL